MMNASNMVESLRYIATVMNVRLVPSHACLVMVQKCIKELCAMRSTMTSKTYRRKYTHDRAWVNWRGKWLCFSLFLWHCPYQTR